MGYKVESHHNIDHMEMVHLMRSATERSLLNDSIVVCILSHGFEGAVYGANSIALSIPEIENVLCSEANVYDKHKLLIIQACQDNNRRQQGMPVSWTCCCVSSFRQLILIHSPVQVRCHHQ